jgi:uncharacterized protein YcbX
MADTTPIDLGSVVSLCRYPVKSMIGEELNAADVTQRGLLGDRAYALVDPSNGMVASAKNPRKWGRLFDFRAAYIEPPRSSEEIPPVRITLPDGTQITSDRSDVNQVLSNVFSREVMLETAAREAPSLEEYWPDMDGLANRETVTDESIALAAPGTFFDYAAVHILTTATIDRLREFYPAGRFEPRRFRPNIIVKPATDERDFVENAWVGKTLAIGEELRLNVVTPCPRCVMTTLPQGDLPGDSGILRTTARHNVVNIPGLDQAMPSVGVYAVVLRAGRIRRGDRVRFEKI